MTQNNVGALVVVKPDENKAIAGIITERGTRLGCKFFLFYLFGVLITLLV